MWLQNKYTKWYFSIITNAKQITGEWHHIIPKSLGGDNEKINLVLLTYREHYICHVLLTKMCIDSQHKHKMIWALHRMTFSGNYELNSHYYAYIRVVHKNNLILNHPAKRDPEGFKQQLSLRIKQSYIDNPKLRELRRNGMNQRLANTEFREAWYTQARNIAKVGGEAARKKLKGSKRPECSQPGNKNATALLYTIMEPTGAFIQITTEDINQYCITRSLSVSSFKKYGKTKGEAGLYQIIKKKLLNERRVGNG